MPSVAELWYRLRVRPFNRGHKLHGPLTLARVVQNRSAVDLATVWIFKKLDVAEA